MTINTLGRKLVRDLFAAKWQYLAIMAMVTLGIALFNASYAAYVNLAASYERSFRVLDFEDFYIQFNSAPERVSQRIRRLPGIKAVEGRLVEDVAVELPGRSITRKLVGRLISIPTDRVLKVNRLKLVRGAGFTPRSRREVLLEASFSQYHKLEPGQFIEAVRGSSRVRLKIAGIVQSAEYLYVVRSKQELMAVPDTFGVMFVPDSVLGPLVGKPNQINEIHATVTSLAARETAVRATSSALQSYNPDEPVLRADQPSYQMLMQDVDGFRSYAILFPAFFLSVAIAAVYTLLTRMVHQQRPIIGLLRSLGLSRGAVLRHYLLGTLLIGVAAAVFGDALGVWLADWTSYAYMSQLQVPEPDVVVRWPVLAAGLLIGVFTCVIGAVFPAYAAGGIRPAEAMRPLSPTFGGGWLNLDKLVPNVALLWRIPMRNVFRQPRRTLSTLFGIVAGIALMMTARGLLDSSESAIDELVSGSYRYDLRLDFVRPRDGSIVNRVRSWPGVVRAEGVLEVPVEFRHGDRTYSAMMSGQDASAGLHALQTKSGDRISIPAEGGVFGPTLRKKLGLEAGDLVEVRLPEQLSKERSAAKTARVSAFSEEAIGTVAYMRREEVWRRFRNDLELPPNAVSGIVVKVAPNHSNEIRKRLYNLPDAGSVLSIAEIKSLVNRMMDTFRIFVLIMELFGVSLALAMIFNMVTINVLERSAEIATLRTIGIERQRIALMVGAENMIVGLIGVLIGLPFGRFFIEWFWLAAQTEEQQELFTFAIAVKPLTYVVSAAAIILAIAVSQMPALRMLARMDLAKATKERAA